MQHSLNKHKKKRFDPYSDEETMPEFQVAPMVDVLLVLLLFFMATATTEVVVQRADLELPKADDSKDPEKRKGQSVVNIERLTFRIKLDEQVIEKPDDLIPFLQKAKENDKLVRNDDGSDYRVFIRADKQTKYSLVKEIMQACAKAGIANVTFAVTKGGEGTGGSAAPAAGGTN